LGFAVRELKVAADLRAAEMRLRKSANRRPEVGGHLSRSAILQINLPEATFVAKVAPVRAGLPGLQLGLSLPIAPFPQRAAFGLAFPGAAQHVLLFSQDQNASAP